MRKENRFYIVNNGMNGALSFYCSQTFQFVRRPFKNSKSIKVRIRFIYGAKCQ